MSLEHPEKVLEQFLTKKRLRKMDKVLAERTRATTLVLDHVHNPHNISAVIRSADAFGIADIHLSGLNFEYSKGISLGAERWINLIKHDSVEELIAELKQKDYEFVILEPEEKESTNNIKKHLPVYQLPFERN